MDALTPQARDTLRRDLGSVAQALDHGTTAARSRLRSHAFTIWANMLAAYNKEPWFASAATAWPWLLLFAL